jgi:hypothetical protein
VIEASLVVIGHVTISAIIAWVILKGPRHCTATVLNLFKEQP